MPDKKKSQKIRAHNAKKARTTLQIRNKKFKSKSTQ